MEGIIIVGYGRMGKEIERQAAEMDVRVCGVADSYEQLEQLDRDGKLKATSQGSPVAIEFTCGAAAVRNLDYLLKHDVPTVCGSTPWKDDTHGGTRKLCLERKGHLMFSNNYSIGVNIFWRVVRQTSRLLDNFAQYDISIHEQHHNKKADSPSGTAVSTAQIVLEEVGRKTEMLCGNPQDPDGRDRPIAAKELQISSQRLGRVAGVHQLLCDSPEDSIVVSHSAHNRTGFARGAIVAAQFLHRQVCDDKPGFFTMDDLMDHFLTAQLS
ncbi:dihydrodipicolinate reductase C-terminal domain-containing protein [Candidatus Haliotispira prima]|uniref:4-hydroxy-tetrahydrodipicolinate reductase n=1 Tax=Candidatus Haliotispira prima TaxID=3034016 RepID=A0ABY8MF22_9SPIO|nr:dihydrodipicolinate reductase C-terminal domain-containing protein [Candidatus Haliotispira prima]